jgi:hypothetical protein
VILTITYDIPDSSRFLARAIKRLSGSETRKAIPDLFYNLATHAPFSEENVGDALPLLLALRSCPSAINDHPW